MQLIASTSDCWPKFISGKTRTILIITKQLVLRADGFEAHCFNLSALWSLKSQRFIT